MMQEYGVHRLAELVVPSEGERQIAHTSAHLCSRQIPLYPLHRIQKIKRVTIMLSHSGGDGQYIGIEHYVASFETCLFRKQLIGAAAYLYTAVKRSGLPLFVECHDHHGSSERPYLAGMVKKLLLSTLQRYGIDNRTPLDATHRAAYHLHIRGIYHHGKPGGRSVGTEQHDKAFHLRDGIYHTVIHIDVEYPGSFGNLGGRHFKCGRKIPFVDKSQEFTAAGYVASLPYLHESGACRHLAWLQPREPENIFRPGGHFSRRRIARGQDDLPDMFRGCAAAATHDIEQASVKIPLECTGHLFRCLRVIAQFIRQASVGMNRDEVRLLGDYLYIFPHLLSPEAAV